MGWRLNLKKNGICSEKGDSGLKGIIHVGGRNDKVYYDGFQVSCNGILSCILTLGSAHSGLSSLVPGSVIIQFLIISLDSSSVVSNGLCASSARLGRGIFGA